MAVDVPLAPTVHDEDIAADAPTIRSRSFVPFAAGIIAALLVATSIVQWRSIYADEKVSFLIGSSCVVGAGFAIALRDLGRRFVEGIAATIAGQAVLLAAAFPGEWSSLASNLVTGWKRLATTGLLVASSAELVAPAVFTCGLLSFVGTWTAWRVDTRARALLAGLLALVVALAYTIDVQAPTVWFGVGFALLPGLLLASDSTTLPAGIAFANGQSSSTHGRRAASRALVSVGAIGVGTGVLTALIGDAGLGDKPFALRTALQRTVLTVEESTPLAAVKAGQVADVPAAVFEISVSGLGADDEIEHIAVVALDRYDGAVFGSATAFTPAGSILPIRDDQVSPPTGPLITQAVQLSNAYPFRSLPRSGDVTKIHDASLLWNASTGTIASLDPVDSFSVTVQLDDRRLDESATLGSVPGSVWQATDLPEENEVQLAAIDEFIESSLASGPVTVDTLLELEAVFRSEQFGYNENAPGGHSMAAIADYVRSDDGQRAGHVGFAEQAAATYVVAARRLGVAARVIVGYVLDAPLTADAPSAVVSEDMIHAWAEVWTEQGWASVRPTNKANAVTDSVPRQPVTSTQSGPGGVAPLDEVEPPLLDPDLTEKPAEAGRSLWWFWSLLLVPLVVAVVLVKRIRTGRRRAKIDPNERALGAWIELRDRLDDLGYPTAHHESTIDLSDRFATLDLRDEADDVLALTPTLDAALYSPDGAAPDQAADAWDRVGSILGGARSSVRFPKRVLAAVDPRTLIRR